MMPGLNRRQHGSSGGLHMMSRGKGRKAAFGRFLVLAMTGLTALGCGQAKPAAQPAAQPAAAKAPEKSFDAAAYYKGKEIKLIVPFEPGGSLDVSARLLAPVLSQYIPGQPNVVVENRPGAGGVTGMNYFYSSVKPDGYTIIHASLPEFNQLWAEASRANYDVSKMPALGGLSEGSMTYMSAKKGIKNAKDLYGREGVFYAAVRSPASTTTVDMLSSLTALGLKFKAVQYPGGAGEARPAVLKGEADFFNDSPTAYWKSLDSEVKNGTIVAAWQTGLLRGDDIVRDERMDHIPTFAEVYKEATGKDLSGEALEEQKLVAGSRSANRTFLMPPGTPQEIVDAVGAALVKAFQDEKWISKNQVKGKPLGYVDGKTYTQISKRMLSTPKTIVERHLQRWKEGTS